LLTTLPSPIFTWPTSDLQHAYSSSNNTTTPKQADFELFEEKVSSEGRTSTAQEILDIHHSSSTMTVQAKTRWHSASRTGAAMTTTRTRSTSTTTMNIILVVVVAILLLDVASISMSIIGVVHGLQIVVPGGTGKLGNILLPKLSQHDCCVLTRNAFLAAAPNRVTEVFGYLGQPFLQRNQHVKLRDWDGGDLLDIVGQDWVGWQDDTLPKADVMIHLVGGYTEQRNLATERLVRETIRVNPNILHITVNPNVEDIPALSPGMVTMKTQRIQQCEDMVKENCLDTKCLRLEAYRDEEACQAIIDAITEWEQQK
jgi:hypothetical protein